MYKKLSILLFFTTLTMHALDNDNNQENFKILKKQLKRGEEIDLNRLRTIDANQLAMLIDVATAQVIKHNNCIKNRNDCGQEYFNRSLMVFLVGTLMAMQKNILSELVALGGYYFALRYFFFAHRYWEQVRQALQQKEIAENNLAILQKKQNVQKINEESHV